MSDSLQIRPLFSRLKWLVFLIVLISLGIWFMRPILAAKSPSAPTPYIASGSTDIWNVHLYAFPSTDGTDLFAVAGKTSDFCEEVEFIAEYLGTPTAVDGAYVDNVYKGFVENLFPGDTNIQEAELEVRCKLPNGNILATHKIRIRRYYAPNNTPICILSKDNNAELCLFSTSLDTSHFIIAMSTNALPGPLPEGVNLVGEPYSFRASGATTESDQNMSLDLHYSTTTLGDKDPLTLRIFEWDVTNDRWIESEDPNLIDNYLNKATKKFTTYVLGSTPSWYDGFSTSLGLETSSMDNINRILAGGGKLKLDITSMPGTVISKPYTPTFAIDAWGSISYTANITTGASLTVSVLSISNTVLISDVTPGRNLADIDPAVHPSLRLRVDMSTTSGNSPELFDWSLEAMAGSYKTYLPIVLKN